MKRLLSAALRNKEQRLLLFFALMAMLFLTIASKLEILAIGIITKAPFERSQKDFIGSILGYLDQVFPISNNLTNLAIFLVVVAVLNAILLFSQRFLTRLLAIRISRDLRQAYFEHIQSLPMSFYQQHHIGSLSSRVVGDAALIAEAVNACLVTYIHTPFSVGTTLIICFLISWKLSLITFLGFPLIIFSIVFLAKRVKRLSKQIQHNQERFASALLDFLSGIQTVKVFAMEEFSLKKYRERNHAMASLEQRSAKYDLSSRPIVHTIAMTLLASSLVYGLYILQMSVADVLVYCGFLYLLYEPIKKFAEENSHIQRGLSAAERLYEVMGLKPQITDAANAIPLTHFNESIQFENVWFRYADKWALKGLTFSVRKGETVAIVGPTGAGKSTVVQLLPRLYDIEKGQILIDGKPITTYTQRSLREMIAFVPQKAFFFLDTVSQNISFGRPFTEGQIQKAAIQAHADEFITQLPKGYQTELAEGGKNLSGGQQQRLAIARALVKEAPILIMDEATSSLDMISENAIKQATHQLRGKVTQIIIAHRLSTIEDADKIIYLEKGEKVAEGTKEELLRICPSFRLMWELMHLQQHDKIDKT